MWLTSINSDTSCRFPVYLETSLLICNAIQLPGFYMKKQKRKTKRGSQRDYSYQRTYFSLCPYIKNYYRKLTLFNHTSRSLQGQLSGCHLFVLCSKDASFYIVKTFEVIRPPNPKCLHLRKRYFQFCEKWSKMGTMSQATRIIIFLLGTYYSVIELKIICRFCRLRLLVVGYFFCDLRQPSFSNSCRNSISREAYLIFSCFYGCNTFILKGRS